MKEISKIERVMTLPENFCYWNIANTEQKLHLILVVTRAEKKTF